MFYCDISDVRKLPAHSLRMVKESQRFFNLKRTQELGSDCFPYQHSKNVQQFKSVTILEAGQTEKVLTEMISGFKPCQKIFWLPVQFVVTMRAKCNITFGDELFVNILFLEWEAVFQLVDTAIGYVSEKFLNFIERTQKGMRMALGLHF